MMKNSFGIAALLFGLFAASFAQSPAKTEPQINRDITGLYSFVREGEFVQLEVNDGKVTGLVSRFKDEKPNSDQFVDQFIDQGRLEGSALNFRTKPLDGVWFEFSGTVERGPAKTPSDEGYWNVKGTLKERHAGADGKVTEKVHGLTLKSFPQDAQPEPTAGADKKK